MLDLLQLALTIFTALMTLLVVHVGWINCTWRVWEWPVALWYVAVVDRKTRNDFWHVVVNIWLISAAGMFVWTAINNGPVAN